MLKKEYDDIFNNRIENFMDYVEMFGDDEEKVELYIYDYIAFILAQDNQKNENYDYAIILKKMFDLAKKNTIDIKGTELTKLYNFALKNKVPDKLREKLMEMYSLNEEKREINYKKDYNYFKNKKDYEKNMLILDKINLQLANNINYLNKIDKLDKIIYNSENDYNKYDFNYNKYNDNIDNLNNFKKY